MWCGVVGQIEDVVLAPFSKSLGVTSYRLLQDRLQKETAQREEEAKQLASQKANLVEALNYDRKRSDEAKKVIQDLKKLHKVRAACSLPALHLAPCWRSPFRCVEVHTSPLLSGLLPSIAFRTLRRVLRLVSGSLWLRKSRWLRPS